MIHKDCYGTILFIWILFGGLTFLIFRFIPYTFIAYPLATIPMFFMGFVLFFFRVPKRNTVAGDNVVTSVADGRIVVIEKVYGTI